MKKIIIVQLARFGDIVQTLPAIQGIKKSLPDSHITLVVRSTFADAAKLSPFVDSIVEFPSELILGPVLRPDDGNADMAESLARLIRWTAENLLTAKYDLLLNLTFSPASAYLSSLIRAKERRGILASSNPKTGQYSIPDPWSMYFFAQVVEHNINILHVNDLFCRIADAETGAWPAELKEPESQPLPPARTPGRKRIAVQLTASSPEKSLSVDSWSKVCAQLLAASSDHELMFFGGKSDIPAIKAVIEAVEAGAPGSLDARCHIAAGRLRFHENPAWLRTCEWLIAPDTAIVHLASACGPRIVQISLGGVRPDETGPYGIGHRVIYPMKADGNQLAENIARIVCSNGDERANNAVAEAITRLTPTVSGTPRNEIVPLNFVQDEVSGFFMQAYYLLAEFRCGGRQEDIPIPKIGSPGQTDGLDKLVSAYDSLCTMRRLSEFGQHYCLKMLESIDDVVALKDLMQKLSEIDGMLEKLQNSVFLIKPLIDTWRVAKDLAYWPSADKGGLEETLALTEGCYRELGQNVDITQQLLQTAVEAAQGKIKATSKRPEESQGKRVTT